MDRNQLEALRAQHLPQAREEIRKWKGLTQEEQRHVSEIKRIYINGDEEDRLLAIKWMASLMRSWDMAVANFIVLSIMTAGAKEYECVTPTEGWGWQARRCYSSMGPPRSLDKIFREATPMMPQLSTASQKMVYRLEMASYWGSSQLTRLVKEYTQEQYDRFDYLPDMAEDFMRAYDEMFASGEWVNWLTDTREEGTV